MGVVKVSDGPGTHEHIGEFMSTTQEFGQNTLEQADHGFIDIRSP